MQKEEFIGQSDDTDLQPLIRDEVLSSANSDNHLNSNINEPSIQNTVSNDNIIQGSLTIKVLQVTQLPQQRLKQEGQLSPLKRLAVFTKENISCLRSNGYNMFINKKQTMEIQQTYYTIIKVGNHNIRKTEIRTSMLATGKKDTVEWNEEFYIPNVSNRDKITLVCMYGDVKVLVTELLSDMKKARKHPSFIGGIDIPLYRLPESEIIERWYSLKLAKSLQFSVGLLPSGRIGSRAVGTAMLISLCFQTDSFYNCNSLVRVTSICESTNRISSDHIPCKENHKSMEKNHGDTSTQFAGQSASQCMSSKIKDKNISSTSTDSINNTKVSSTHKSGIPLPTGIVDYVIWVGPPRLEQEMDDSTKFTAITTHKNQINTTANSSEDIQILSRYPSVDYDDFPLPTKIEWFCFPSGAIRTQQMDRPKCKIFTFVLAGGVSGTSRCYGICLIMYHQLNPSDLMHYNLHCQSSIKYQDLESSEIWWSASCLCLLTRIPLIDQLTTCLISLALTSVESQLCLDHEEHHEKLNKKSQGELQLAEQLLINLVHDTLVPLKGVFGVQFFLPSQHAITLTLPNVFVNNAKDIIFPKLMNLIECNIPAEKNKSATSLEHQVKISDYTPQLPDLEYSLEIIFTIFDVKTVFHLLQLLCCEFRLLVHSTQLSLLSPTIQGLCALLYPYKWQHPCVPILPSHLLEYIQAPLPYILGAQTSCISTLLAEKKGLPDNLVLVDIDKGQIELPFFPTRRPTSSGNLSDCNKQRCLKASDILDLNVTAIIQERINRLLYPALYASGVVDKDDVQGNPNIHLSKPVWSGELEFQIRLTVVHFFATIMMGYRECLFYVNTQLPVFNKQEFLSQSTAEKIFTRQTASSTPKSFNAQVRVSPICQFIKTICCTQMFQDFLENQKHYDLQLFHEVYNDVNEGKPWSQSMAEIEQRLAGYIPVQPKIYVMETSRNFTNSSIRNMTDREIRQCLGMKLENALNSLQQIGKFWKWDINLNNCNLIERKDILHTTVADNLCISTAVLENYAKRVCNALGANISNSLGLSSNSRQKKLHYARFGSFVNSFDNSSDIFPIMESQAKQLLQRCLMSVFSSETTFTPRDFLAVELELKNLSIRSTFVTALMQSRHDSDMLVKWRNKKYQRKEGILLYQAKGSGYCLSTTGFNLLARLCIIILEQCLQQQDYTNAVGIILTSSLYFHYPINTEPHTTSKEYLLARLKSHPICKSLELWQFAFCKEMEWAVYENQKLENESPDKVVFDSTGQCSCEYGNDINKFNPSSLQDHTIPKDMNFVKECGCTKLNVDDEIFFSISGSLAYKMFCVNISLDNVHKFIFGMCKIYKKSITGEVATTLQHLVENLYTALDLSSEQKSMQNNQNPHT